MTRQEIVIKITKVTRVIGELKNQLDLDGKVEFAALDPDWPHIAKWVKEIHQYIKQDYSPALTRLIENIGFTGIIADYIENHRLEIGAAYVQAANEYIKNIRALQSTCQQQDNAQKGEYTDLIKPLANKQAATLLQRAVQAGILDEHYQPVPGTKDLQLKVVAFAISSLCGFPHAYVHFEKQWEKEGNRRFSTCRIPKRDRDFFEKAKALYPEVDFSEFEPVHDIETFYTPQSKKDIRILLQNLVKYNYIASDTTFEAFKGIFNKADFETPIEWTKTQRQLSYFVYLAFGKLNKKNLWIKGERCFHIGGETPHKACFISGYSYLKRSGRMDRYDVRLKAICEKFNHTEEPSVSKGTNEGRLIHTSKSVFYSPQNDKGKFILFSALVKGEYIAPETTFVIFKGIFDESIYECPVIWIKSQTQLMYFVHVAFKSDNPYDVWTKCVHCFRLKNGKVPNRNSLESNIRLIKKKGILDTYDTRLKSIADKYTNSNNKKDTKATPTMVVSNN